MSNKVERRSGVFRLLKMVLMIIGCGVFLFSVFSPYLRLIHWGSFSADVWSFKATFHDYRPGYTDAIFIDHNIPLPELPWINIMILIAQILVIATGITSLFVNKKILAFAPSAACLTIIILILYVSIRIGHSVWETGYSNSLQAGFYTTLFSLPFYLIAFMMELASSRSKHIQETNTGITETKNNSTPTQTRQQNTKSSILEPSFHRNSRSSQNLHHLLVFCFWNRVF